MSFSTDLLKGKSIMVTGAGKGIGKACALLAASLGAHVIAVARTQRDLDVLTAKPFTVGSIEAWAFDVQSPELHKKITLLSSLDGLINNAGTNKVANMIDQTQDNYDAVMDLNVKSVYMLSQAALKPMLLAGRGSIVHMSSQMAFIGAPGRTLYCMSKHAIEGLTKAMAVELAPQNIRVNTVAPTFVMTPMTKPMLENKEFYDYVMSMLPLGRLAEPEDIANACMYLLSDMANMITGTSLKVDGGWTAR
ncbi:MAG: NAD(P)-dependent dehydrogenase (short-subunit alcohol dehydrogenase family) [Alphaproteobacteria bacterium]|jgi:NAD(P)-dependent dehydrogenase (short-subunit alcohol dehydrogenase family)